MDNAPMPWGWLYYFWCKRIHRFGYDTEVMTGGNVYRCRKCGKAHYFKRPKQ